MTDRLPFNDSLQRVMDANVRYVGALGRLTQEYWRAIVGIWRDFPIRLAPRSPAEARPSATTRDSRREATLVLEARAGEEARGVFMVENRLDRQVSTAVVTSSFSDRSGHEIHPTLRVVPGVVTLEPGARSLVQLFALISTEFEAGVAYRGEMQVPGLSETGIPVLLRRPVDDGERRGRARKRGKGRRSTPRRSRGEAR
jgi:hypothetical protein